MFGLTKLFDGLKMKKLPSAKDSRSRGLAALKEQQRREVKQLEKEEIQAWNSVVRLIRLVTDKGEFSVETSYLSEHGYLIDNLEELGYTVEPVVPTITITKNGFPLSQPGSPQTTSLSYGTAKAY